MNGYFQIVNRNNRCHIKLVPPVEGGEPINRNELTDYLSLKNMEYDFKALCTVLDNLSDTAYFPTSTEFKYAEGEYAFVSTAQDGMTAFVRLVPPFEGGVKMPKNEFMREFTSKGIVFGLKEDVIDAFLNNRQYCTTVAVAFGKPPVHGVDAKIEYFFNTDPRVRPTLNEDGTVDFFHLNTINHCKAGDLLARLTPAVIGEYGTNVRGEHIRPKDARPAILKFGHNISENAEKTEIFAEVSGHVSLVEGKVFVSNVFEVENVDTATGNIDYEGDVRVNGNVCENFSIKASGDIEVRGVVEGAYLEAGGNISIARGMNGMHKGVLKATGNIVAKFIENSQVSAEGYVEAESILHSTVISGLDVKVEGRKGFISGGRTCATNSIEVKNLGSSMGADTVVEVGMDTALKQHISELQKQIVDSGKQLATIKPVLDSAKQKLAQGIPMNSDQIAQVQKLAVLSKELTAKLSAATEELNTLQSKEDPNAVKGQVIVTGDVFPGTKIVIGDVSMVVKSSMKYCRFIKQDGDVKMVGI